jgi:AraC-like DNA-binding protein
MENTIKMNKRSLPDVFLNYYQTPHLWSLEVFACITRAGHFLAGPDYKMRRTSMPGHELFLCLSGRGYIEQSGKCESIRAGQIGWLNVNHPHAHWADLDDPWEVYWLRVQGSQIEGTYKILSTMLPSLVFDSISVERVRKEYESIFEIMRELPKTAEARLNASMATLIALLFESLNEEPSYPAYSTGVGKCVDAMRFAYHRSWKILELARLSGMSEPHLFRVFKKETGVSPIVWLRRERMNHAKRRLVETNDSIAEIAEQVGFEDPFYFSREFKRVSNLSPRAFRESEVRQGSGQKG